MAANSKNSETAKKLLVIFAIIVTTGFAVYKGLKHFSKYGVKKSFGELMLSFIQSEHFNGRVLVIDTSRREGKIAVLTDRRRFYIYQPWEYDVNVGDSVVKKVGTIQVIVYRSKQDSLVLDYGTMLRKMNGAKL